MPVISFFFTKVEFDKQSFNSFAYVLYKKLYIILSSSNLISALVGCILTSISFGSIFKNVIKNGYLFTVK